MFDVSYVKIIESSNILLEFDDGVFVGVQIYVWV